MNGRDGLMERVFVLLDPERLHGRGVLEMPAAARPAQRESPALQGPRVLPANPMSPAGRAELLHPAFLACREAA